MQINNFDEYCQALKSGGTIYERACLLRYIRSWLINVQALDKGRDEEKLGYVGLTELLNLNITAESDEITRIAKETIGAMRHIANSFRDKIVREKVMMPTYKAKELDSAGLSWLSKRSGRTIREKLSSTNSLLAVRRRLSLDTGENRLFLAFVRELEECIEQKRIANKNFVDIVEEDFQDNALKLLHNSDIEEIGRWENLPPNNTLLSDRFYRQIWRGWTDLQNFSEIIKSDDDNLGQRLCLVFFWKLASHVAEYCHFAQQPVIYDYLHFMLLPFTGKSLYGWHAKGIFSIRLEDCCLSIYHQNRQYRIKFADMTASLYRDEDELQHDVLTADTFDSFVMQAVQFLFGDREKLSRTAKSDSESTIEGNLYIDLFTSRPIYLNASGEPVRFAERIMRQTFIKDNHSYDLPVNKSTAMYIGQGSPAYSIASCMHTKKDASNRFNELLQMVGHYLHGGNVKSVSVPLPDIYNEFQLSAIRRALHLHYSHVQTMPRSIAVLFYELLQQQGNKYNDGDFVLVVDYIKGRISLTLVEAKRNPIVAKALPETEGIIWERHPTYSKECRIGDNVTYADKLNDLLLKCGLQASEENIARILKVFGVKGLPYEADVLAFAFGDTWSMLSAEAAKFFMQTKLDASLIISDYLQRIKPIIGNKKVHVCIVSPYIHKIKQGCTMRTDGYMPLHGFQYYSALQSRAEDFQKSSDEIVPPLWSDQLPALSIKRLYGEFPLIDPQNANKISPQFGREQEIPIPRHFVLPQKQSEYRFGLIMGKNERDIDYEAVVRHRAFPLKEDVECELKLTYTYGKDMPYELTFMPVGDIKPFHMAEVLWEDAKEHPYMDLQSPKFPADEENWQSLQHIKTKRKEDVDALDWIEGTFQGRIVIDFDNDDTLSYANKYDNQIIVLANVNGRMAIVRFSDKDNKFKDKNGNLHGTINLSVFPDNHKHYKVHFGSFEAMRWRKDVNGQAYCFCYVDEEHPHVAFFESALILGSRVEDMQNCDVIFDIKSRQDGKENASRIIIDKVGYESFFGARISCGNIPYDIENPKVLYPLHKVYFNGRSSKMPDCPAHFRDCIRTVSQEITKYFVEAWKNRDVDLLRKLFRIMCIMHTDIGHDVYDIANVVIKKHPRLINDDFGCIFGDYDSEDQQKLLILLVSNENIEPEKVIAILSKAAWKNEGFMRNAPPHILLSYFDKALVIINDYKSYDKQGKRNVLQCLEYVLAIFRLRNRGDADINKKLSLNNSAMQSLYATVEDMIDSKYELPASRVQLEAAQSEEFRASNISDFYYALLVYITGGEDEIKLAGINEAEE